MHSDFVIMKEKLILRLQKVNEGWFGHSFDQLLITYL